MSAEPRRRRGHRLGHLGRTCAAPPFSSTAIIGAGTEIVGAVIVLAEVAILFAGVVSRYVFDSPIIWTDELANFLFLWLAMLGTVVAFRRDGHMRLTTLVNWVRPNSAAGSVRSRRWW